MLLRCPALMRGNTLSSSTAVYEQNDWEPKVITRNAAFESSRRDAPDPAKWSNEPGQVLLFPAIDFLCRRPVV